MWRAREVWSSGTTCGPRKPWPLRSDEQRLRILRGELCVMTEDQADKIIALLTAIAVCAGTLVVFVGLYVSVALAPSIRCYLHRWSQWARGVEQTCTCRRKP